MTIGLLILSAATFLTATWWGSARELSNADVVVTVVCACVCLTSLAVVPLSLMLGV